MSKPRWTQDEIERLKELGPKYTSTQLQRFLGRSSSAIRTMASRLGTPLAKMKMKRVYKFPEPNMNLTQVEAAYIAGIIDGEGCLQFHVVRTKNGFRVSPRLSVGNTNKELIDWLKKKLGNGCICRLRTRNPKHNPEHSISIEGFKLYPLLKTIKPFLIVKRKACDLLMRFIKLRANDMYNSKLSLEELEIIKELRDSTPNRFKERIPWARLKGRLTGDSNL